jgi:1,4-dihydroxy-2-naphthoate octaprenyltransferase
MEPRRVADRAEKDLIDARSGSLRVWLLALRPFSFTASIVPAIYGGLLALALRGHGGVPEFRFDGLSFLITIVGCVAIHAGSNLVNDFFDYRSGTDKSDNFGRVNVLVRKLMRPVDVSIEAAAAFLLAALCGIYLILQAGSDPWPLIALVVFGALSAYFYTAPPFAFKNRGFGDAQVMLSFALAMVFGAFYVQAHTLSWLPVIDALPIGFLVVDILHINNLRDLVPDRAAGIRTLAIVLGSTGAKRLHHAYVIAAYATTVALVCAQLLSPWTLVVAASLPRALTLGREVQGVGVDGIDPLIVVKTARFHALFGGLLILGVLLGIFI